MTAEFMQIFFVRSKSEAEIYKTTLFDDSEVEEAPCSYKATCQTGTMIASLMSIGFLNYVANKMKNNNIREIPFYIEYGNPMMDYKCLNSKEYVEYNK